MQRSLCVLLPVLGCAAAGCVVPIAKDPSQAQPAVDAQVSVDAGSGDGSAQPMAMDAPKPVNNPEPLPPGEWTNVTMNLAGMSSECGDLSGLSAKPDEDRLIAGVALRGLFSSTNLSANWQPLGTESDSEPITNRPNSFVYDPEHPTTWWVAGIYNGFGVFVTTDNGKTFRALGDLHHIDTVAIDFRDPARKLMIAGGHDQAQTVYRSADGGATWSSIGQTLPPDQGCQSVAVIDAQTYLIGCDHGGEAIHRTIDAGNTWHKVSDSGGSMSPLFASDGSIYWARLSGGLVHSTDQGETWQVVTKAGLKALTPIELPDGRIAALGSNSVVVSSDHAATWQPASAKLPFEDPTGFVYSTQQRAFLIKHSQCVFSTPDTVLPDAIMRFDFE